MELTPKIPSLLRTPETPPPPRATSNTDWKSWKLLIFDVFAVFLAAAVGYECLLYFSGGVSFTIFAATGATFLIISFFDFLFASSQRRRAVLALLQALAFLGFFYAVKPTAITSALAALVVFYFLAIQGAAALMQNSIKFRMMSVAKIYMKRVFVGFVLAAILLYLPQWNSGNVFVPQPKFQQWYDGFAELSQRFYSGVDLKANVGTFTENIVRSQLSTNAQFKSLPQKEQDVVVQVAARELIVGTSKSIGLTLVPETPLADAVYKYLLNFLTNLKTQFGDSFLAAWAVALFVIVLSVGTVVIWAVVFITYLLFEFLAAFNFLHIVGESQTKEIVELS